jgi:uncharacterized protein (DUF2235 family)
MKNIVLCCDGTANEFSDHNTNVVKLYQLLEKILPGRSLITIRASARWKPSAR